jgi:hypothetical protein
MNLKKQLSAIGVPPLIYEWSIKEMPPCKAKTMIELMMERVDRMIVNGGVLVISLPDNLLASRLAVTLLKAAILNNHVNIGYIPAADIKNLEAESWENGDSYDEYLYSDFLVIDNINPDIHGVKFSSYLDFLEKRLRYKKATILSSTKDISVITNGRITNILESIKHSSEIKSSDL